MSKKNQWKKTISEHVAKHYGELKTEEAKTLNETLEQHWKLNQQHAAYFLSRIGGLFLGVGVGATLNLSAVLPAQPLTVVLGRSIFMALSYMAGSYLSASLLEKVLPALDKLEQSQLGSLFKKADTLQDFLQLMQNINNYLTLTVTKDKDDRNIEALSVFAGNILNVGFFAKTGTSVSKMAIRSLQGTPVVASFAAPKIYRAYTQSIQLPWTKKFDVKHSAAEDTEHNEGLRQRRSTGAS